PVALHLLEHGDGDGGLARRHGVVLFGSFAPRASSADCGRIAPLFAHPLRGARTFNCQQPSAMGSGLWVGRGVGPSLSFLPLENEGSDAPRRRVVRITPDGPDDHSGRTRIAGSWRISGCAAPTRRATRHLPLSRSRPVGPSPRSLCRGEASRVPPREAAYVEPPSQVPHPAPPPSP